MTEPALSFTRLDRDGALAEAIETAGTSRAAFLAAAAGSLGLIALQADPARAQGLGRSDRKVLNFALTLEYLQAAFYTEAERLGALRGDAKRAARVVGSVERAHVAAFKKVLGKEAVKRPEFDFQGTTESGRAFLKTAVAFEDLAVAAYQGQVAALESDSAVAAAVSIHSVEARHAAWMRYLVGSVPAAAAFDTPRSKADVSRIVRSTNFISDTPSTVRKRAPRFTG